MAHLATADGLVGRAIRRDSEAFAEIYRLHSPRVFRHAYYLTGKKHEADDITSDTFLRAWSAIERYEDRGLPIENWLLKIAHNLAARHARRIRPTVPVEFAENEAHPGREPEQAAEAEYEAATVRAAILKLPPVQRQVVVWRFLENMGYDEVEAMLGKSQGAIRVIQYRALLKLRELLEPSLGPGSARQRVRSGARAKLKALARPALGSQPA